jgi:hypothetical protein
VTLSINTTLHYNIAIMLSHNAQCRILLIILLNVIMLRVVLLNVVMLNAVLLNVIMPSVVLLNVVMLNVVMLNVVMLNVVMLNVVMLNVVMLSVITLYVIMLSVVAPLLTSTPNIRLLSRFMPVKKHSNLFFKCVSNTREQKHSSLLLKYAVNKIEHFITND